MNPTPPAVSKPLLQSTLKENFGWEQFKTGQEDVIRRLLEGHSTLAVFPTGGGKSLCYQLPALMLEGLTLVVSPLIALMKDQVDQLASHGVCAVRLESSLSTEEYRDAMQKIRSGAAKILYVAPERFFNERFRGELEGVTISLFAIDEAHCISQWGHNFRPDYLKLTRLAEMLEVQRVLCLTATATPVVQQDICRAFDIAADNVVCTDFFRPNLHLKTEVVSQSTRDQVLIERLSENPPGATVIYVTLQKTAERVADLCQQAGLDARHYHAGMNGESRAEVQDWFMAQQDSIVVATIAFGMGIDKRDIRYVYHYNPPKSMENYAQEVGRAGRDGEVSTCLALLVPEDRIVLENFVFGDTPTKASIQKMIQILDREPDEFFISQIKLGNECDIRAIVTRTLLTYLELDGHLQATTPRYQGYKFKPKIPSSQLLDFFEGERREFIQRILACSQKRKIWFEIDVDDASRKWSYDRGRIVKAFNFFAEKDWMELKTSGLVFGYRKLKSLAAIEQLADHYFEKVIARENAEIERVRNFLDFACAGECVAAALSRHFGQQINQSCGNCSYCLGLGDLTLPAPAEPELDSQAIQQLRHLMEKHPAVLNTARAAARLLCGIRSPALSKARLTRIDLFGSRGSVPFDTIMNQVAAELNLV